MLTPRSTTRLLAVSLVAAMALAGCGKDKDEAGPNPGGPTADSGCGFHSGPFSDAVKVSGDFGGDVTAEFARPFRPQELERTILTRGTGKETKDGTAVEATASVFNGKTGALLAHQSAPASVGAPNTDPTIAASIRCVPIGSRVVSVAPASTFFSDGGAAVGLAASDGVVIVTDVSEKVKTPEATGWTGAPDVTFRVRKSPRFTVPTGTAPDQVLVDVIRPGTGQVIKAGNQITVDFKAVVWGSGKVVRETYGPGGSPVTFGTNDVVPGFTAAVVGQKAGARLVVAIPPAFGYGANAGSYGLKSTDTLVFVIEIQSTKAP